jgi:7,8-dihydropterin-6-yl-methyl-4-(beta-D-ribofuranosyl)aminobenzene 5'-phosphate synthase
MIRRAGSVLFVLGILAAPAAPGGLKEGVTPFTDTRAITVATVFDNYAVNVRLTTRWGFAAVVSTPAGAALFDTGTDGATLLSNMDKLGIDPSAVRQVVISHSHSDHLGGLRDFLRHNADVQVFIPRSFPDRVRLMIKRAGARHEDVSAPTRIAPGIRTTGPLGQSPPEQALIVETSEGLVVITGCAHPGILSIVRKVQTISPNADIALVMGGLHLLSASGEQIEEIVRTLRSLGVRRIAPSHCTGDIARRRLREVYGPDYIDAGAGMVLKFAAPAR